MSASLKGKSVVVTGGSKGIGKGIARVFAGHGAKVLIVARHLKDAEATAQEFTEAGGTASAFAEAGNGDVSQGFVRAMKARDDVEIVGGYVFRNTKGQTPLNKYLNSTVGPGGERPFGSDDTDKAFESAVEHLLYGDKKDAGVLPSKASDVLVYRMPDDKTGVPQFTLSAVVDGEMYRAHLSAKDIYKLSDQKAKADARAASPRAQISEELRTSVQKSREQARAATSYMTPKD